MNWNCFCAIPADRRYYVSMTGWMVVYVLTIVGLELAEGATWFSGAVRYVAAVAPSLPIGGVIWAVLALIGRSDEYVRTVMAKRFIVATGGMMFLCTAWGFLETYAGVPHIDLWIVFPLFWLVFGLVSPFIRSSR